MVTTSDCSDPGKPDVCAANMGLIHLQAGDLVGAYRFFLPEAERVDEQAIAHLIDISVRAGDHQRADAWRQRLAQIRVAQSR